MRLRLTFMLLLAALLIFPKHANATCPFVTSNVQVSHTAVPQPGIVITWLPDIANLGVTKYDIVLELTITTPHRFDTIHSGIQPSRFIPYTALCNGEYLLYIITICPDGTRSVPSAPVNLSIISDKACYLGTTICPGVTIDATSIDIMSGSKKITIPCDQTKYTLKPELKVVGGSIVDYVVKPIPFSPPYPLTDGDDIPLTEDDAYSGVTYLPFRFCFYENVYNQLLMGPNGFLSFNTQYANQHCGYILTSYSTNLPIPNFGMPNYDWRNAIYGVFEDIDPRKAKSLGVGSFKWGIRGNAPCRVFVNSYFDIPLFSHNELKQSYQIVLYEGTNIIDVYVQKRNLPTSWNGRRGIIGVQNKDGTKATCAPGRNITDLWSTKGPNGRNQPEAWRFVPVTQDKRYTMTWTDMNGKVLGTGDSITVDCRNFVRNKIIANLEVEPCSGGKSIYRDTVILGFDKAEQVEYDTICQTEPYKKKGWDIPPQYIVGDYEFFRSASGLVDNFCGCDTVYTLRLRVNKRPTTDTAVIACLGDTVWLGNKFSVGRGFLLDTIKNGNKCDSIVVMNVQRYPSTSAALQNVPEICADAGSFVLGFAKTLGDIIPSQYKIDFDAAAEAAGFVDQSGTFDTTTYNLTVLMPAKIYPDTYCADISFVDTTYNCEGSAFKLCFDVYYPDTIMQQKWGDVIALKNKHYNGGFEIAGIQWYKDIDGIPTPIVGQTKGTLQTGVVKGSSYRVEITRPDGTKMLSCPLLIKDGKPSRPVIVVSDNIISIFLSRGKSIVNLWTISGILLKTSQPNTPSYEMSIPERDGTYLLEVISEDGTREVKPVVVNRSR